MVKIQRNAFAVVLLLFITLTDIYTISQAIIYGELVMFGGNIYSISGGINRGLTSTQID